MAVCSVLDEAMQRAAWWYAARCPPKKIASKRAQSQACLSYAEREQFIQKCTKRGKNTLEKCNRII